MCSVNRRGSARDFHILFVPRRSLLCEQRFKDLGVLGSFIHREEYSLDLIPFDGDLLSMESEGAFKECYLESEQTSLYHAAKGLMTLQALYGTIPQIFGKGECARQVANMMIRMKREFTGSQNSIFPVFDNLLLLDRNVDLLSPLATQLMYEGLIDEIYGIQNIIFLSEFNTGWFLLLQVRTQGEGANQEEDCHLVLLASWSWTSPPEQLEINIRCLFATRPEATYSNPNGPGLVLGKPSLPSAPQHLPFLPFLFFFAS
ncbi:vacuolar protein sorting-associated protein 33A-like isoform X1 [Muntiacus reevesi]|uniref:vacuolar protein sorting-associated protein 33A-like isoform X1 n=1 Tax=Muntiacus reevesi TaxID=9886 RepID=UPI0033072D99